MGRDRHRIRHQSRPVAGRGVDDVPEGVWMPGVLSRKKQVAAPILRSNPALANVIAKGSPRATARGFLSLPDALRAARRRSDASGT